MKKKILERINHLLCSYKHSIPAMFPLLFMDLFLQIFLWKIICTVWYFSPHVTFSIYNSFVLLIIKVTSFFLRILLIISTLVTLSSLEILSRHRLVSMSLSSRELVTLLTNTFQYLYFFRYCFQLLLLLFSHCRDLELSLSLWSLFFCLLTFL